MGRKQRTLFTRNGSTQNSVSATTNSLPSSGRSNTKMLYFYELYQKKDFFRPERMMRGLQTTASEQVRKRRKQRRRPCRIARVFVMGVAAFVAWMLLFRRDSPPPTKIDVVVSEVPAAAFPGARMEEEIAGRVWEDSGVYEKPAAPGNSKPKLKGWRAASEPGGYMGGQAMRPDRLPAYSSSIDDALQEGYHVSQRRDSVSVEPFRWNCSSMIVGEELRGQYPKTYPIGDILSNWPPDTISVPPRHFMSLCRFDYRDRADVEKAFGLRDLELPFVVYNNPDADRVAHDWSQPGFLEKRLGKKKYKTELSEDNHFMYYNEGGAPGRLRGWSPPTNNVYMRYEDWLVISKKAYNLSVADPHYYFRVSPPDMKAEDVPFFLPPKNNQRSLFLTQPKLSKGVHCRFGAAGIVAEAHYDGSRNMVAELGGPLDHPNSGRRRYVLAAPDQCDKAYLLPRGHPSGRHSTVDWSRPVDTERFPLFSHMRAIEVIMEPGDILYIPHFWLHYIVSLGTNFQCNTRSGRNAVGADPIRKCGFL